MPEIIDNREKKLSEYVQHYLELSRQAHFAVGYFYVEGFMAIAQAVRSLDKLRLLIGAAAPRKTIEQIALGYKSLEAQQQIWHKEIYARSADRRDWRAQTLADARQTLSHVDQTEKNERLIVDLAQLIEQGLIEVRIYLREPLHAKCYIFDEKDPQRAEKEPGRVILGSSNLTVAGLTSNTELNVVLHDPQSHQQVSAWFERLWQEAEPFQEDLLRELKSSWALNEIVTPWEIYLKTLLHLLPLDEPLPTLPDFPPLAEFQKHALIMAQSILEKYGGVLIADEVGLGKTYVGLALLLHGRYYRGQRPLVICPAALTDMWQTLCDEYDVGAPVVSMGVLSLNTTSNGELSSILDSPSYEKRDLILIDESHHLRYSSTQRYQALERYLSRGERQVIMLTATPYALGPDDIQNQLRLWPHQGQHLPTGRWRFEEFFRKVRSGEAKLPELLQHIMLRRGRHYIANTYGEWRLANGDLCPAQDHTHCPNQCFPIIRIVSRQDKKVVEKLYTFPRRRLQPPLSYRIDEAYPQLYETIRRVIDPQYKGISQIPFAAIESRLKQARQNRGASSLTADERKTLRQALERGLCYARYGLFDYVLPQWQNRDPYKSLATAGRNLRGLMRVLLFKRLESSVYAFRVTCETLAKVHLRFVEAMKQQKIPAGEKMQEALYNLGAEEIASNELLRVLQEADSQEESLYKPEAFDVTRLQADLEHDALLFTVLRDLVAGISPAQDAKLQALRRLLERKLTKQKVLIFTQFEDTAQYLYQQFQEDPTVEWVSGRRGGQLARIVSRFAPSSNPALVHRFGQNEEIRVLFTTDVLAEGLNLQDATVVINYDLHFNPVRLIQRIGRLDRLYEIASLSQAASREVQVYNFFPETQLDTHLQLREKVQKRIEEMRQIVGLDQPVLQPRETLDEEGVLRLYTGDESILQSPEEEEKTGWYEAQRLLFKLQQERPEIIERIKNIPDGVRSARVVPHGAQPAFFVFCQAGEWKEMYIADAQGKILTTDSNEILKALACDENEERAPLPSGYNKIVCAVKKHFAQDVAQRQTHRLTQPRMSVGQNYVLKRLRELRIQATPDEQLFLDELIIAYQQNLPFPLRRSLNELRKQKLTDEDFLARLHRWAKEYNLFSAVSEPSRGPSSLASPIPYIICSEALPFMPAK